MKSLVLGVLLGAVATSAHAVPIQISDRSLLPSNDFVDWGVLGPAFTLVPDGSVVASHAGGIVTVNNATNPGNPFRVVQQIPPVVTGFWNGNFAPGDKVLAPNGVPGSILIQFASPVAGAGAQIQGGTLGTAFMAFLAITDTIGTVHLFSAPGFSSSTADNSAIFLGVLSDVPDIVSIEYSAVGPGTDTNGPGINRLDIVSASVPEPTSLVLLVLGALAVFAAGSRKGKSVYPPPLLR